MLARSPKQVNFREWSRFLGRNTVASLVYFIIILNYKGDSGLWSEALQTGDT